MAKPANNPRICDLLDDAYRFVGTDRQVIHCSGTMRYNRLVAANNFDLLLGKPVRNHVELFAAWRKA